MKLKKVFLSMLFLMLAFTSKGQLLLVEKDDIIKENGYDYKTGTTDNGTDYIVYERDMKTKTSGRFNQIKLIYFVELDSGEEISYMWRVFEPSSETNTWVNHIKEEGLVKVDYMQWKDYENNILYHIKVEEGMCILTAKYDREK